MLRRSRRGNSERASNVAHDKSTFSRDFTITDALVIEFGRVESEIVAAMKVATRDSTRLRLQARLYQVRAGWHAFQREHTLNVTYMDDAERADYEREIKDANTRSLRDSKARANFDAPDYLPSMAKG